MSDKTKLLKLRDELLLLRAEVESAIKEVTENNKRRWLSSCKCEQNAFASTKYGFVAGYTLSVCNRLLGATEKPEAAE